MMLRMPRTPERFRSYLVKKDDILKHYHINSGKYGRKLYLTRVLLPTGDAHQGFAVTDL